jgi:hypothetical protein
MGTSLYYLDISQIMSVRNTSGARFVVPSMRMEHRIIDLFILLTMAMNRGSFVLCMHSVLVIGNGRLGPLIVGVMLVPRYTFGNFIYLICGTVVVSRDRRGTV